MECDWLEKNIEGGCQNKPNSTKSKGLIKKPSILEKRPFKCISIDIEDNDKR